MSSNDPGHLFNLSEQQKAYLREYWKEMLQYFSNDVDVSDCSNEEAAKKRHKNLQIKLHKRSRSNVGDVASDSNENISSNADENGFLSPTMDRSSQNNNIGSSPKTEKRNSFSLFKRKSSSNLSNSSSPPPASPPLHYNIPTYKGFSEIKLDDNNILDSMKDEFSFLMASEDPDSVALRFLRARKWNVQKAVKMTTACLQWRVEWNVRALLENGEQGIDEEVFKSGKAFLYGVDKEDRPLSIVRVRFHNKNTVPLFESEKFTMFMMETGRLMIKAPVEMCSIIFDMTEFSMQNMDYAYVKFVLHCLQNYYPESLGTCFILNAPWIFNGCWKIIKPLLDPVVSSKVHFVKTEELKEYINEDQLLKIYGGTNEYEYTYIPPSKEDIENEKKLKEDYEKKTELLNKWRQSCNEFNEVTKEWIDANKELDKFLIKTSSNGTSNSSSIKIEGEFSEEKLTELKAIAKNIEEKRKEYGLKQIKCYVDLIPYTYTKTYYHRIGRL